jgi:hypothetical protein
MDLGLSQSTVAEARRRLAKLFYKGDESNREFIDKINEVIERFHSTERWVGSLATFRWNVETDKSIYLPYFLDSINAATLDSKPARVQGPRYEFVHDGPGLVEKGSGLPGAMIDAGVFGISTDYPENPSTLTVSTVSALDAGESIRILGYDHNGAWITDAEGTPGEKVTLSSSPVSTVSLFSGVKGIQKGFTRSHVSVAHAGTGTVLANLENWMTNPRYRCYRVTDTSAKTVTALCKRRPVPVQSEEDYIFPGDLSALKLGLFALHYEEESETARRSQYFREAIELLNEQSASYKGGAQEQASFEPWGPGVSGIGSTY